MCHGAVDNLDLAVNMHGLFIIDRPSYRYYFIHIAFEVFPQLVTMTAPAE